MKYALMNSPIGTLTLVAENGELAAVSFGRRIPDGVEQEPDGGLQPAIRQLEEYFAGRRQRFDLALRPVGTAFQRDVWSHLLNIPYGETWTYGEIARRIGSPGASRAVGRANHSNPIPIIIPCHRVIGRDGSLTGYGGGLEIKSRLLALESAPLTTR